MSHHDEVFDPTRPALVLLHGECSKKFRALDRAALIIGRARGCDLGLDAPDVSSLHCVITRDGPGFHIRDCGSRAGTRVNGQALKESALHDADLLQIGPFCFQLHIPGVTDEPSITPSSPAEPSAADSDAHWQQFQDRCRQEELRLLEEQRRLAELETELQQRAQNETRLLDEQRQELDALAELLERERSELAQAKAAHAAQLDVKENLMTEHNRESADVNSRLEQQSAALHQTEEALREQRELITRMMSEMKQLQQSLRAPRQDDLETVLQENEQLRLENEQLAHTCAELERAAAEARLHANPAHEKQIHELRAELKLLRQLLDEKNVLLEELRSQASAVPTPKIDADSYEAELIEFRRQLEGDQEKLNKEIEQLRARNQELDQATREMELEMSRERAELARERQRLERQREEMRLELERAQRTDNGMRDRLAPVQRLREEMNVKQPPPQATPVR